MRYSFCAPLVINPVVLILQTARRETVRRSTQDLLEREREREEGKKRRNVSFLMHARGGGVTRATLCNVVESFALAKTRDAQKIYKIARKAPGLAQNSQRQTIDLQTQPVCFLRNI